jgi:Zn-dependent protease/predicted transcriptional regulator
LAFIGISYFNATGEISEAIKGVLLMVALFGTVVLHELGHALAARRYGIATRDITLLPIGGVARLERMPEDPWQELVVAVAGPAVNVALALGSLFLLLLGRGLPRLAETLSVSGDLLSQFFAINVVLVLFNMLPAFPMDGGRVLRALLAMRMDYVRATQVAAGVGQAMALLFGFLGLFGPALLGVQFSPMLVFIALFVWIGAAQEASMAQMRSALHGIPVQNAMITDFRTLRADDTLQRAVDYVVAGFQQDFPVVDGETPVGVLTLKDMAAALAQHGPAKHVAEVMQRKFSTTGPRDMLVTALAKLQEGTTHVMPVVQDGRLLGLLTADNLAEVLMINQALSRPLTAAARSSSAHR